jgi:hypothetical protein
MLRLALALQLENGVVGRAGACCRNGLAHGTMIGIGSGEA